MSEGHYQLHATKGKKDSESLDSDGAKHSTKDSRRQHVSSPADGDLREEQGIGIMRSGLSTSLSRGQAKAEKEAPIAPLTAEHLAVHTKTLPAPSRPRAVCGRKVVSPEGLEVTSHPELAQQLLAKDARSGSKSDSLTIPLLRASPPIPVGTLPGRYKVRLWRAATDLPWGLAFGKGCSRGARVSEDAPHLGIRKGDEVLSINSCYVEDMQDLLQMLGGCNAVELLLYHRESSVLLPETRDPTNCTNCSCPGQCVPGTWCYCEPSSCGHDVTDIDPYYDALFYPKSSQVRATRFLMQDLLQTSGRIQKDGSELVQVLLTRMSLEQRFPFSLREAWQPGDDQNSQASLPVEAVSGTTLISTAASSSCSPKGEFHTDKGVDISGDNMSACNIEGNIDAGSEKHCGEHLSSQEDLEEKLEEKPEADPSSTVAPALVLVQEPWPWLGLRDGDQLVSVNGLAVTDLDACQEMMRDSMSLSLELRGSTPPQSEEFFVVEQNDYTAPAIFPAHWARGLVEEDETQCCPVPLVQRRTGAQVEAEVQRSGDNSRGPAEWFFRSLGLSSSTCNAFSAALPKGSFCFCTGVAEEAEPFNLTPDVPTQQVTRAGQSGGV